MPDKPDRSPVSPVRSEPDRLAEYLMQEIGRLEGVAEDADLQTLAYLLSRARIEASNVLEQTRWAEKAASRNSRSSCGPG